MGNVINFSNAETVSAHAPVKENPAPAFDKVKFLWNGVRFNGKLYLADYYISDRDRGEITICGKHYRGLPKIWGLKVINNTDYMSDYFENDLIRVPKDSLYYALVLPAYEAKEAHDAKIRARTHTKRGQYRMKMEARRAAMGW